MISSTLLALWAESSSEKATKMTSFEVPVLALSVLVGKTRTWRRRRKEKRRREAEALGLNELGKMGRWGEIGKACRSESHPPQKDPGLGQQGRDTNFCASHLHQAAAPS